jgi:SpoIIAA-like
MIERIPDLPSNVLGFSAKGTVTRADYETVINPAVEALLSKQRKVRFLYHLGEDFSGFETAAMWEDTKIGLKHLASWDRIAVVTDVEWIRAAMKVFGFLLHGHVRVFQNSELTTARDWVSG